jgi:hypothetical protein
MSLYFFQSEKFRDQWNALIMILSILAGIEIPLRMVLDIPTLGWIYYIDLLLSFHYFKYYKNAATLSIVIVGLFFGLQPANKYFDRLKIINNYNILETDIARASARDIIGSDALVGGRIASWFISGGQQWYDLIQDLIWNKDRPIDQQQYISMFDAIVENNFMSYQSSNIAFGNPNNWYLKKLNKP